MSDSALRARDLVPGTEPHAAALARVGRWAQAEAIYRQLRDAARESQWSAGLELEGLPISETRGPIVSERARFLARTYKALMLDVRRFSRARAECERQAAARAA